MTERRLGVFICHCGGNISDYVDTEKLREAIEKEPSVVTAQVNMFTCSDAAQQNIVNEIQAKNLDGIVVASCSPKLHLNTFRAMARRAGLNEYQYTQVNIREQCSWAHTHNKETATEKAMRLVRAGIARAALSRPLEKLRVETLPHALVIGAGVSGLRAALALSDIGIGVHLIEKSPQAGGMVSRWGKLFPNNKTGDQVIHSLLEEIRQRDNITLFTDAELAEKQGHVGDFSVKVRIGEKDIVSLKVGSIIVTTGFETYTPQTGEFGFGLDGVITLPEYEELLASSRKSLEYRGKAVKTVTYIYCVGSRENTKEKDPHLYCSRYCCSAITHCATCVSEMDSKVHQFHLYRDIRTYGKYELLYEKSLSDGSMFLKYEEDSPPQVTLENGRLLVRVKDRLSGGEEIEIGTDLVVLVTGMVPRENAQLLNVLKLPVGKDGFFNEVHPKLRPVETMIDGVFIAGAAQGPKTIAESVASAMAAVAKTGALLLKGYVDLEPLVAKVNSDLCTWCGKCATVCPYGAIEPIIVGEKQIASVSSVLCKGEGACVPVCPYQAIAVEGYSNEQIESMIDALAKEVLDEKEDHARLSGSAQR
jgi:heterodisulfide reductase subunit A2